MKHYIISLLCSLFVVSGYALVQFCDSDVGTCKNVTVSGCPQSTATCLLKRGTNVGIVMEFTVGEDTSAVNAVVHGVVSGIPVPFHVPNPDACKDCGLTCPLKKGSSYTYVEKLPIKKLYPKVSVEVKWQLEDADGKVICCALIPSRIV